MRSRLLPFLLLAALPACFLFHRGTESNVLVIVVDSLRFDALSQSIGSARTPNLNALAADGLSYRSCYAHSSSTLPAHTAILSSRPPGESGVRNNGAEVPGSLPMLQAHLRERGWQTFADVSDESLLPPADGKGIDRGFSAFRTHDDEGHATAANVNSRLIPFVEHASTDSRWFAYAQYSDASRAADFDGTKPVVTKVLLDGAPIGSIRTMATADWSVDIDVTPGPHKLELRSEDSFYLRHLDFLCEQTSLRPEFEEGRLYAPLSRVRTTFSNDRDRVMTVRFTATVRAVQNLATTRLHYKAQVEAVDKAVGEVVAALKAAGKYDDTIIVVTGSHGEALGEHGVTGHDVTLYDEVLRVPLLIKPASSEERRSVLGGAQYSLVRHIDVAPTLLEMVGESALEGAQGLSLYEDGARELVAETHPPDAPTTVVARRDDMYKLVFVAGVERFEMYDVKKDTLEMDNLFELQGHFRSAWQTELRRVAASAPQMADQGSKRSLPTPTAAARNDGPRER